MIFEQIQHDLKEAMKQREQTKVMALRSALSAMKNALVEGEKKETLTDEEAQAILKKLAKQRKESITQYKSAGRDDLVEQEEKDLQYLEAYLPEDLTDEHIQRLINEAKEETGATTKQDMGKLMGVVMQKVQGQADGNRVKNLVMSSLS